MPLPFRRLIRLLSPILFIATLFAAYFVMMGESPKPEGTYLKFETVRGYFLQDEPGTEEVGFDYAATNFGLINRAYDADNTHAFSDPEKTKTQWQRFDNEITYLNQNSDSKINYKVLYMGRHGQGYHNVAESFYGTKAWDCYWSLLDGNSTSTWADAHLTEAGIQEALKGNNFWKYLITEQKITTPQSYYTSPLIRCMQTAYHTFSGLPLPASSPFIPTIKEGIREVIGVHTCDRRSSKTVIGNAYPEWPFEEGFSEEDELWRKEERETAEAQDQRTKVVLDDILGNDKNTHLSISSHSGEIGSILRGTYPLGSEWRRTGLMRVVLGHREFRLGTGQMIPVLVKIERVKGTLPPIVPAPWERPETCDQPPPMI